MPAMEWFVRNLMPFLPDWLVRWVVRRALYGAVAQLAARDWPQKELRFVDRTREMETIAVETKAANLQHYEVPTEFFETHLGTCLKYSSCEWPKGTKALEEAETITLDAYLRHMEIEAPGVKRVLDMGCGWGSFSLYAAQKYPALQFVCFSNSTTQIASIKAKALDRGLTNLKPVRMDINDLSLAALGEAEPFDRVIAIESLEHSHNYEEIFQRIRGMMSPQGLCFVQLLCHREYSYSMQADSWMGRNFFTGGVIPSTKLFYHFTRSLVVERQWVLKGTEYTRTLDAWLDRLHRVKKQANAILRANGCPDVNYEFQKWRMFYIMSSEAFKLNNGQEWMVTYLLLKPR